MKTKLIVNALDDVYELADLPVTRSWAEEMQGGMLFDAGPEEDTLLLHAEQEERLEIFRRVRDEGLLVLDAPLSNLVFCFGRPGQEPDSLLHAVAQKEGWLLRLVVCSPTGYGFCPVTGTLPYDCSGLATGKWAPGGQQEATPLTAFMLMDLAVSGFVRLSAPKTRRQQLNRSLFIRLFPTKAA